MKNLLTFAPNKQFLSLFYLKTNVLPMLILYIILATMVLGGFTVLAVNLVPFRNRR